MTLMQEVEEVREWTINLSGRRRPGAESSRDKGPHMGVGFVNSKKGDVSMGRIKGNTLNDKKR